jgi:alpha-N-acetylglucosaminidase
MNFWRSLGLTDEEMLEQFSGPAFLAWERMGNIRGWGGLFNLDNIETTGPLYSSWIDGQMNLQKKIVQRQREFGMTTVLPAFAGKWN